MPCSPVAYAAYAPLLVTSLTRPTGQDRLIGMFIYEGDTSRTLQWDGTGWIIMDEPDQSFTSFTVASASGTITTVGTKLGRYKRRGGWCLYTPEFGITTNGTGATSISVQLPVQALSAGGQVFFGSGREVGGVTAKGLAATIAAGATTLSIVYADGTYPGASGGVYGVSIEYPMTTRYS